MASRGGEGKVWPCAWKKEGKGYRIALEAEPGFESAGPTFGAACAALREKLLLERGDGEAVLDFRKAPPKGVLPARYAYPELLWVSGNDSALAEDPGSLFEGGICATCGNPVGRRNGKPAVLSSLPAPASDGAEARHIGSLFSEDFVKLLSGLDGARVEFRETTTKAKGRKALFEICGEPLADFVAVDDVGGLQGVKCAKCKRKVFHHMVGHDLIPFLARSDLPARLPPCFAVRNRETLGLCMTGAAWRGLQGKPGTRNLVGVQMGVATDGHVVRDPDLPLFKG